MHSSESSDRVRCSSPPFCCSALSGTALDGLKRYRHDAYDVLTTYWCAWPAVHFTSFTIVPTELRVGFVACVSFCWLIYLSYASHKEEHLAVDANERKT